MGDTQQQQPQQPRWAIVVHGGAGAIDRHFDPERVEHLRGLHRALEAGAAILRSGGTAMEAAIVATQVLEDDPLFNAGRGSVLTAEGKHELDAAVMRGSDMRAGAVTGVTTVKNPVLLARSVLLHSPHVLLAGSGAEAFADTQGVERVENSYFTTEARLKIHQQLLKAAASMERSDATDAARATKACGPTSSPQPPFMLKPVLDHSGESATMHAGASSFSFSDASASPTSAAPVPETPPSLAECHAAERKYGTVGAVALDLSGELASAVSTGGMSLKAYGRVGDSPIVGAGIFANRRVAVCCTGNGEAFMRACVAKDVQARMEYGGVSLRQAAADAIAAGESLIGPDFEGGLIAVDSQGNITLPYNSKGMYRGAFSSSHAEPLVAVWEDPAL